MLEILLCFRFCFRSNDDFWIFEDGHSGYFYPIAPFMAVGAQDGTDVAYIRNGATVCQTLGDTFVEGRSYSLSVWVGDRDDQVSPGYDIELRHAGDNSVVSSIDETDFPLVASDWREAILEYTVPALAPEIGEFVIICLSNSHFKYSIQY